MTLDEASEEFRKVCKFCVNVGKFTEIMCRNLMRINSLSATWEKDTGVLVSEKNAFLYKMTRFPKISLETVFICIFYLCLQQI